MPRLMSALLLGLVLIGAQPAFAQPAPPNDAERLSKELAALQAELAKLKNADRPAARDALVCAGAVDSILRHEEFYKPNYVKMADSVLKLGLHRAAAVQANKIDWGRQPGRTVLAYRSRVDDSLQPYAVTLPEGYGKEPNKRWPLHLVLHGRNGTLTETSFIAGNEGKAAKPGEDWIQLDVFGRINNAYRWAGETDVFEALADVEKRYRIDERRITLWGFSMGGAGAWHLAVHHPDRWSSAGAGAGFVDFYKYQKKTEKLPEFQHKGLHIYDAVDYALNLANIPMITYGGEVDPQLLASQTMQARADELGTPVKLLVGPGMGHKFDDASFKSFMEFHAEHSRKGLPSLRGRSELRFETYTLKYNQCGWLTIEEQQESGARSTVESTIDSKDVLQVTTTNVRALSIERGVADRVQIDGSDVVDLNQAAGANLPEVYFVQETSGWNVLDYDDSVTFLENPEVHKRHNLQGPIDDAFMESFLCVRGTGQPWTPELQKYAEWSLSRFEREFDKWMRGRIRIKDDSAVTDEDIAQHHLILFGDPGSNSQMAAVLDKLPIRWTKEGLEVRGQAYDPTTHAAALVFPNPLNPKKYVVINSGMTMHEENFKASNAWLFPKLGDIAVLKFGPAKNGYTEETVWADFFNADWELK